MTMIMSNFINNVSSKQSAQKGNELALFFRYSSVASIEYNPNTNQKGRKVPE